MTALAAAILTFALAVPWALTRLGWRAVEPRAVTEQRLRYGSFRFAAVARLVGAAALTGVAAACQLDPAVWVILVGYAFAAALEVWVSGRPGHATLDLRVLLVRDTGLAVAAILLGGSSAGVLGAMLCISVTAQAAFCWSWRGVAVAGGVVTLATARWALGDAVVTEWWTVGVSAWATVVVATLTARIGKRAAHLEELVGQQTHLVTALDSAQHRERQRLSEALHDDALQQIITARQDLLELVESRDPADLECALKRLDEATTSLRALMGAMHSSRLRHADLGAGLQQLLVDLQRRRRVLTTLEVTTAPLTMQERAVVVAVCAELLGNVAKHAAAEHVCVTVAASAETITLQVADDGQGIPSGRLAEASSHGHFGHAMLKARATSLGGHVHVESHPGTGTDVTIQLSRAEVAVADIPWATPVPAT